MNILTTPFPETVTIDGQEIPVYTDFRAGIATMIAFEDDELTVYEKQRVWLENLYYEIPNNLEEAINRAQWFLNGGRENGSGASGPRVYSFTKDGELIYGAFSQAYGIDLQSVEMHWWRFYALFMDLFGQEVPFSQLVILRKRIKTGKATKEEVQAAQEMGDFFDIPDVDDRSLEEAEATKRFWELVEEGERNRMKGKS
jgi:Bacteriophage Gp15 protein